MDFNCNNEGSYKLDDNKFYNIILLLFFGLITGIVAGYGAVIFRLMISFFHNILFFAELSFNYNTNKHTTASIWSAGIIVMPAIVSLAVTWLIKKFAPEAKGHGVPEVIDAVYYNNANIRPAVAFFKSLASALSIGSGGSVGREGPIIQIGAAFGSTLGQIANIPAQQRITLLAAGAGAGIAATFNAPIGGILFAVELLLVSINAKTLTIVAIATISATYIGRFYLGIDPAFNIPALALPQNHLTQLNQLYLFIPFGIIIGCMATLFIKMIYWFEDIFNALPINDYFRHALGMIIIGIMMYAFLINAGHYYVQGVGYATIVDILNAILHNTWFLLLLCAAKLAATSLTLGSGGSGGIFSPGLFIGACSGAALGNFAALLLPHLAINPTLFAVAGMAGMISGATGAILTAIIMMFEMTRDYNAILPIILTAASATFIRRLLSRESIYTLKLLRRNHIVAEGLQAAMYQAHKASNIMNTDFYFMTTKQLTSQSSGPILNNAVIIDSQEKIIGLTLADSQATANTINKEFFYVTSNTPLTTVFRKMRAKKCYTVLVIAAIANEKKVAGFITAVEITRFIVQKNKLMDEQL